MSSKEFVAAVRARDFSECFATVVGYGTMGRHYVHALRALGVKKIRVCSRSPRPLRELGAAGEVEVVEGGFERLECDPDAAEVAIVATPMAMLAAASEKLASLGFRRMLIEKPVSLWSRGIQRLAQTLDRYGVQAACAYNRVAYPSFLEARTLAEREGGITSCTYNFTEIVQPDWTTRFPVEELARWGIANSLHVMSMAHGLIGMPADWSTHRSGALSWHPTGVVFVGSGVSVQGVPFAFHADWGSKGRWAVEIHTAKSSYRLRPLEKLFRKTSATGEWEEATTVSFSPEVKAGVLEQVAAMLAPDPGQYVSLLSLRDAAELTAYAEDVFAYGDRGCS
jgi:predicted dehydrogenase